MVRESYLAYAARPHGVFDRHMTNPARSVAHYIVTQLLGLEELVRRDFRKPITLEGSAWPADRPAVNEDAPAVDEDEEEGTFGDGGEKIGGAASPTTTHPFIGCRTST
jgi:hypothetical protein